MSNWTSKKGETYLSVLVALLITMVLSTMLITVTKFMAQNQADIREPTLYRQTVHNTVMATYATDDWWTLSETIETKETPKGTIKIEYREMDFSIDYFTETMEISFAYKEDGQKAVPEEVHQLERSVLTDG